MDITIHLWIKETPKGYQIMASSDAPPLSPEGIQLIEDVEAESSDGVYYETRGKAIKAMYQQFWKDKNLRYKLRHVSSNLWIIMVGLDDELLNNMIQTGKK